MTVCSVLIIMKTFIRKTPKNIKIFIIRTIPVLLGMSSPGKEPVQDLGKLAESQPLGLGNVFS